jgi:hypothetical protein
MTQPVDSAFRRIPSDPSDSAPSTATAAPARSFRDLDVDSLPAPVTDYGPYLRSAPARATAAAPQEPAAGAAARAKLDAYRSAYAGPYNVAGQSVLAPTQFRMVGGHNDGSAGYPVDRRAPRTLNFNDPQVRSLRAICARANAPDPTHCLMGCASPREIVGVTQALIDAGELRGPGDLPTQIKAMQWRHGIGVDCTDYVIGAALQATGKSRADVGGVMPGTDYFANADQNPHLRRVGIADARPGDVFCLDDPGKDVGHRTVVYSRTECSPSQASELARQYGRGAADFLKGGPVQVFLVDSSWGAGDGSSYGGVARNTWLYNASTSQWAQIAPDVTTSSPPSFSVTPNGPKDDLLHGLYRIK